MSREKLSFCSKTSTLSNGLDHSRHDGINDAQHDQSTDGIFIWKIGMIVKYFLFCIDIARQTHMENDIQSNFPALTNVLEKSDEG